MAKDTHIYMDTKLWEQIERVSKAEDRSVTATIRVLIKEALHQRNAAKEVTR